MSPSPARLWPDVLPRRGCSTCRAEQPFESPNCPDGHGADCPDQVLVCVECGTALTAGPLVAIRVAA